jgi:hypothetical protein
MTGVAEVTVMATLGLEHAVISDGKKKHDEYGGHRENRMMKHPMKGWFKDSTTGDLEPLGKGIKQIHAPHTDILPDVEAGNLNHNHHAREEYDRRESGPENCFQFHGF